MKKIQPVIKSSLMKFVDHVLARRNLSHLGDWRALSPVLGSTLFEAATVWPYLIPFRPDIIIDIGAYKGKVADQLSILYRPGFIGLVEPQPEMGKFLESKKRAKQQKIFNCAVGRCNGEGLLNVLASTASSSLLEVSTEYEALFNASFNKVAQIKVPIRTLESIYNECGIDRIDLLKIDVQGYELDVLKGGEGILAKVSAIVVEVSFIEHYLKQPLFPEVCGVLSSLGFSLSGIFGCANDSLGVPLQCDAVFLNRKQIAFQNRGMKR